MTRNTIERDTKIIGKKKCKGKIKLLNSCLEELVVFNDPKKAYIIYINTIIKQ